MTEKLLLDVDGAAAALTMSRREIERLTAAGELPSVKIRSLRRYRTCDLEHFVAQLAEDSGAAGPSQPAALAGDHLRNGHRRRQRT